MVGPYGSVDAYLCMYVFVFVCLCVVVFGHVCLCLALVWLCVGVYTSLYVSQCYVGSLWNHGVVWLEW